MHNLITRTSETYFRNILNAYFPYLLLINCQIEVHIQIVDLKVSLIKILSVEVYKSLDDLWAANLLCDPALTAEQFIDCCSIHTEKVFSFAAKIQSSM